MLYFTLWAAKLLISFEITKNCFVFKRLIDILFNFAHHLYEF
ncbi:hypothetical protein HMPREF9151_00898 [Hoylesella saccharolytica F0055]|uniref:Uncharacterized protein n=1 Tax=Hoylesella saccharolytica F0055 TaxID=1127699 RepID=L1NFM3_9BACT|nr:hypothetical protein HMPREF9151_00898 [Hoylesella saccharolytica F0055]